MTTVKLLIDPLGWFVILQTCCVRDPFWSTLAEWWPHLSYGFQHHIYADDLPSCLSSSDMSHNSYVWLDSYVWLLHVSIGMSNKQPQYSTYKLLVFQTQIALPTDLSTSFDVIPSFSYLSQNVGINSAPLFLSYPISDPSSKSIGSTFKIFLESVHFQRPLYLREATILFSWMTAMLLMAISVPPMPTASYPLWSI